MSEHKSKYLILHAVQELLELYDKIGHTKKMGIMYSANTVTDVSAGLQAEREGVRTGWRIGKVCRHGWCMVHGCCMPAASGVGMAFRIRVFASVGLCCACLHKQFNGPSRDASRPMSVASLLHACCAGR